MAVVAVAAEGVAAEISFIGIASKLFGIGMIIGPIILSGVESANHLDDVKKSVVDANTKYDEFEKKWQDVFASQAKIDQDIKDSITTTFTNINDSIIRANTSRKLIQEECKNIQHIGIIAILIIFILLLMKHFDLFNFFDKKNV